MRETTISTGGQVQVPAEIRRRWNTRRILVDDRGDSLVIRPVPDDPIGTALRSLKARADSTIDQVRQRERDAETQAERDRLDDR